MISTFFTLIVFSVATTPQHEAELTHKSYHQTLEECISTAEYLYARLDPQAGRLMEWGCRPTVKPDRHRKAVAPK